MTWHKQCQQLKLTRNLLIYIEKILFCKRCLTFFYRQIRFDIGIRLDLYLPCDRFSKRGRWNQLINQKILKKAFKFKAEVKKMSIKSALNQVSHS